MAYEITKIVHGEEEAIKAQEAAKAVFAAGGISDNMPTIAYEKARLNDGLDLISVLVDAKLCSGRGDARRNIEQGGVSLNDVKVLDAAKTLSEEDMNDDGCIILKKGKKNFYRITFTD